ncbi:MAG: dihydropyrimidinase [Dehalococcoidia bacterium]|nr:dihydropyrimidinase [Dehalococcoidia bacterium]
MFDLLIEGGQVVLPGSVIEADIAIAGEAIGAIGKPGVLGPARRRISAHGLYVLPGGIDPHVHLRWPPAPDTPPGLQSGTVAAAFGGTTTVIDFTIQGPAESFQEAAARRLAQAQGHMAVDYGLHLLVTRVTPETLGEIREIVHGGITSFKLMTAYRNLGWMVDDGALSAVMVEAARCGALAGLHAENEALALYITKDLLDRGHTGVEYYEAGRPSLVEGEAVQRAIYLARKAGAAIYFFHISSEEGLEAVRAAQRSGQTVYAETCPHYLTFTDEVYRRPEGRLFTVIPPIRKETHRLSLWQALEDGTLSCIGSDDAVRTVAEKQQGDSFDQIPMGLPGIGTRLPILDSEGVARGRLPITRLADLLATGPARIFGLYPKKGVIAPGSDADLVLLDPAVRRTIRLADLHLPNDYTIYEGWEVEGRPVMTILRGNVIVENGQLVDQTPRGRFQPRAPFPTCA